MPGLARHPGRTHSVSEVGLWCVKDRTIPPEKTEALCTSVGACAGIRHCDRRRCAAGRRTSQRVPTRPQHNRGCGVLAAPTGRVTLPRDYGAVRRIYLTQRTQRRKAYFSRRVAGARRDAAPPKAHAAPTGRVALPRDYCNAATFGQERRLFGESRVSPHTLIHSPHPNHPLPHFTNRIRD